MSDYVAGVLVGVLISVGWLVAACALMAGVGWALHRHDCTAPDLDDAIEEALAAVADVEADDCRLWELECGWQS